MVRVREQREKERGGEEREEKNMIGSGQGSKCWLVLGREMMFEEKEAWRVLLACMRWGVHSERP